jgi:3-oxoacyl-[acyl-carrier-protein] synthase II
MNTTRTEPGPVITGWTAVSPFGYRPGDFADGLRGGHIAVQAVDPDRWAVPDRYAGVVPGFEPREVLGKRNTRGMDRMTALAVAAVGHLVRDTDDKQAAAVVLGTTTGSHQSMTDLTRDTLIHDKPFYIEAAHIPNAIMNCAAGQCAIWYGLMGPNTTVAAGRVSGFSALNYARRLLAARRADTVICGAAEEYSPARAWWEWHSRTTGTVAAPLGEGCAMVRLEPAGSASAYNGIAEIVGVGTGTFWREDDLRAGLSSCVLDTMGKCGAEPGEVWGVSASEPAGPLGAHERAVLGQIFAGGEVSPGEIALIGDTAGATAAFQLAAMLTRAADDPSARGRAAVLTAVDPDGVFGCVVLRFLPSVSTRDQSISTKELP